ncbi:MAG: phage portal protein family [Rickettsiales bacterium]|jgi:HK97 family phage portal protein|nr:phage portal protein family [Rickettsiales bacterium]
MARSFLQQLLRRKVNPTLHKKSIPEFYQQFGSATQTYVQTPGKPVWMPREYRQFADEAFTRNVIAYRSISMIVEGAASVDLQLHRLDEIGKTEIRQHPLLTLLSKPNPTMGGAEFFHTLLAHRLISGNAFVQAVGPEGEAPMELHNLRPDRVEVIAGPTCLARGYRYTVGKQSWDFPTHPLTGQSRILHVKHFHPLNDWYGLSPIEAAAYAIDQHNQAGAWNQSLLQNGARPSGALIVKEDKEGLGGRLTEEQFQRLKNNLDESYSGAIRAGRPLLLEGGLEWKEMSLSPKDMDFIEMKHSAARDIALAFGVPPQLLGIPGDNKYQNMAEARLALWEQTILPLLDHVLDAMNNWLVPMYKEEGLKLSYDSDSISALLPKRENMWNMIESSSFLTVNEKRQMLGLSPLEEGEGISVI